MRLVTAGRSTSSHCFPSRLFVTDDGLRSLHLISQFITTPYLFGTAGHSTAPHPRIALEASSQILGTQFKFWPSYRGLKLSGLELQFSVLWGNLVDFRLSVLHVVSSVSDRRDGSGRAALPTIQLQRSPSARSTLLILLALRGHLSGILDILRFTPVLDFIAKRLSNASICCSFSSKILIFLPYLRNPGQRHRRNFHQGKLSHPVSIPRGGMGGGRRPMRCRQ